MLPKFDDARNGPKTLPTNVNLVYHFFLPQNPPNLVFELLDALLEYSKTYLVGN
jgi:hypothetical protein